LQKYGYDNKVTEPYKSDNSITVLKGKRGKSTAQYCNGPCPIRTLIPKLEALNGKTLSETAGIKIEGK